MPRLSSRQARTRDVLKTFIEHHRERVKRLLCRKNKTRRALAQAGVTLEDDNSEQPMDPPVDTESITMASISTGTSSISSDSSLTSETTSDSWSDLLGMDWRSSSSSSTSSTSSSDSEFNTDSMPDLYPAGYPDSDDDDDSSSDNTSDSGDDADDEDEWNMDDPPETDFTSARCNYPLHWVRHNLDKMYDQRYEQPRTTFPRCTAFLRHVLSTMKDTRPDLFRQELRVSPRTFDRLVAKLSEDPVFANNSNNAQMPVEDQLAITLFRFGHSGNAAGLQKVANWAGVGKGTITLVTRRVMTAVLRPTFMSEFVRMPTAAEKEKAKAWVEAHSCKAWRNGWCMVDGTLVALFDRPFWFGESYFDRKCNYSLNIQVVSLPNLRIIDFGYGYTGSAHDSTAWQSTRMAQEHRTLLEHGEFIWADSAYTLEKWMISPYKKPYSLETGNEEFNNHVSMVRIRSEHTIGFLKGRFQSLKGLRISIKDEKTHQFATYWVAACIGVHSFAMHCEQEERGPEEDEDAVMADPFIGEGLSSDSDADANQAGAAGGVAGHAGKAKREYLKRVLFQSKERRRRHRVRRQREELGLDSSM
ncbi:DDE Tnp4 domain-containing protein [Mycena sanguinolenta]|uniref:DDE Tnp4 domain-containing protein n=1 Tax=Mycena sanguinolenta TaxID=230812 RepID=A0A8H6Z1E4_9AGAR|nr:DDE Tnp4 domain-containing protein [Mycena sanguinolenta]